LTPLHWAARNRNAQLYKLLVSAGADARKPAKSGEIPVLVAAKSCNSDLIAIATPSNAQVWKALVGKSSIVHEIAANCSDPSPYAAYLDAASVRLVDGFGRTPLWYAANQGSLPIAAYTLKQKADASAQDRDGVAPLHLAAAHGNAELVNLLLSNGADPEVADKRGNTALMLAAARGHAECIALLLPHTSSIDLKNGDGETALMLAVKAGKPKVVRQISDAGASFKSRSISRDTPQRIIERTGMTKETVSLNSSDTTP
jgi:uncharacterized protein